MPFISARSATLASLSAIAAGSLVFLASNPFSTVSSAMLTYNAAVFAFFAALYYNAAGGFESHFNVPQLKDSEKDQKIKLGDVLYYTTVTHGSVGYGDIYPLTRPARTAVTTHIVLTFAGLAGLFYHVVAKKS